MIYVVMIYEKGSIIQTFKVNGFESAVSIQKKYEDMGYDVDLEPDAFSYLSKTDAPAYTRALETVQARMDKDYPA